MYNRYVPQADGSYRRNKMEDQTKQPCSAPQNSRRPQNPCPAPKQDCLPIKPDCPPQQHPIHSPHQPTQIGGFLRQLLPKDFDTADLIIVLLLLLLAGDCEEDRNTAMLTLVLYLFM